VCPGAPKREVFEMKLRDSIFCGVSRLFYKLSYRNRIVFCFLIATILPIISISYINFHISTYLLEEQVKYSFSQTLQQVEINIGKRTDQIMQVLDLIVENPKIQKLSSAKSAPTGYDKAVEYMEANDYLTTLENNFNIFHIRIYKEKKGVEGTHFYDFKDMKNVSGIDLDLEKYWGTLEWKSTYLQKYLGNEKRFVFSGVRVIKSLEDFSSFSICFVDILEDELYRSIEDITGKDGTDTCIIDNNGFIVSSKDKSLLGKSYNAPYLSKILQDRGSGFKCDDHLIIYQKVHNTDLILVSDIPLSLVEAKTRIINKITIVVVLFSIIFSLLLSMLLSNSLSKRLNSLLTAMRQTKNENNEEIMHEVILPDRFNYNDEIDQLIKTYNKMVNRIKTLIDEVYQTRLRESESRFRLLQTQINPHFLYNILESIKSCIAGQKTEKAINLIISLSQFYRIALSKGKDKITIEEEINMTATYVNLHKMSYGDDIELYIEIDNNILPFLIYKFTLQPVVENAIKHGLGCRGDKGIITIKGYFKEDDIVIQIIDNGIGIEKKKLTEIHKELSGEANNKRSGFGLYNVNERLRFYNPNIYGIKIFSEVGNGTVVEITIPQEV
jgi:two-component system sensor histidine kinase YesM